MEHYVTLFDSLFLPQGLALHKSLENHAGNYTLWVLCMDDIAHQVLEQLNKPNIRLIALSEIETPELLAVKPGRNKAEYCWTLTPFTPKLVFERDNSVKRVTYLDADLFFLADVTPIFNEFEASGKAVLITDHAYSPECDQSATSGQFCVQFVTFKRDKSEKVRSWWEARCIEWCFSRQENGKFGDQKYLDCWPDKFADDVHILQKQEWMLAPWNSTRFPYSAGKVYHFHGLRILEKGKIHIGFYQLPNPLLECVYRPYSKTLHQVIDELRLQDFLIKPQRETPKFSVVTQLRIYLANKLKIYLANKLRNLLTYKQQSVINLHDEF
jgi:hypothetical protein